VAFECILHETMQTPSRYVFFGAIKWMAARPGLIDTEAWRVNLRDYSPVARFGASFYIRCGDRFAMSDAQGTPAPTDTPIDRM
jgi:flavin reductase (DIM6/NTAB) family NADH-FMN oxidoreductase RutF